MAELTIHYELRPCLIGAKKRKGLFHRWVEDVHAGSVGIIEYEDGSVARVTPKNIHFLDSASRFAGQDWNDISNDKEED